MPLRKNAPDKRVHFLRLLRRRGASGPNGPDRFVSNDDTVEIRGCQPAQTPNDLVFHSIERLALIALLERFANADYRRQSRSQRSLSLLAYNLICFQIVLPALGVPNYDMRAPRVMDHESGNFAGVSAFRFLSGAILRRDLDVRTLQTIGDAL